MIFGNINNQASVSKLPANVLEAIEYAKNNDLLSLEVGEHVIRANELFFNYINYTSTTKENRFWESHREYIDVHVVLEGNEKVSYNLIDNMNVLDYEQASDFVKQEGESKFDFVLTPGDFCVLYPEDSHMTCLQVKDNQAEDIKKVVFKVKLS